MSHTTNGYTPFNNPVLSGNIFISNDAKITNNGLIPYVNGTLDLGSTTNKWNNVYANTIVGDVVDADALINTLTMDITNQDTYLSRTGTKTLTWRGNPSSDMTLNITGDLNVSDDVVVTGDVTADNLFSDTLASTSTLRIASGSLTPVNVDCSLGQSLTVSGTNATPTQILIQSGATSTVIASPTFKVLEDGSVSCTTLTRGASTGTTSTDSGEDRALSFYSNVGAGLSSYFFKGRYDTETTDRFRIDNSGTITFGSGTTEDMSITPLRGGTVGLFPSIRFNNPNTSAYLDIVAKRASIAGINAFNGSSILWSVDFAGSAPSTNQVLGYNGTNAVWQTNAGGDVTGPASATANSIPRYNSTTGKIIKTTNLIVDDSDNVTGVNNITGKRFVGRDSSVNSWLLTGEVIGESFQRFMLSGDGTLGWSDGTTLRDVLLKRNGANSLRIENLSAVKGNLDLETINSRTADNFVTGPTSAVNNKMVVFNSTTGRLIKSASWVVDSATDSLQNSNQSTNTYMMEVKKTGSSQVEFGLTNEGDQLWGSGSATYDTLLQRTASSTLALSDQSSTSGSGTLIVGTLNSGANLNFSVPASNTYSFYCGTSQHLNLYANDASPVGAIIRTGEAGTINTNYTWGVGSDGIHSFGSVAVPVDTYFWRTATKKLSITNTSFGSSDMTFEVGTVNHQIQNVTKTDITAAGANQSAATTITQYTGWITINAGTGGIKLGSFLVAGDKIHISNLTGSAVNIYPNSTNQINALGASNPYSLGANSGVDIRMYSSTQSYTY